MAVYVINEDTASEELAALQSACTGLYDVSRWPDQSANCPADTVATILIIRSTSTALEEARTIHTISLGLRVICVFLEEISPVSDLSQKYCSTKASLHGGSLLDALGGNEKIQEDSKGAPAARNRQKPHNC